MTTRAAHASALRVAQQVPKKKRGFLSKMKGKLTGRGKGDDAKLDFRPPSATSLPRPTPPHAPQPPSTISMNRRSVGPSVGRPAKPTTAPPTPPPHRGPLPMRPPPGPPPAPTRGSTLGSPLPPGITKGIKPRGGGGGPPGVGQVGMPSGPPPSRYEAMKQIR